MMSTRGVGLAAATVLACVAAALGDGVSMPYLVRPGSEYQRACFQPCRCNLDWRDRLAGRFTLTRGLPDPAYLNFTVSDVRLAAPTLGEVYTGAGTFQRGSGPGGGGQSAATRLERRGGRGWIRRTL